jgi:hypothetical protein
MEIRMNKRHIGIFGLAALALALAAPAHAAPDYVEDPFIGAKRDRDDEVRQDQPADRGDTRRANRREVERDDPRGYGYGYERRQQQRNGEDDRPRGRR